MPANFAHQRLAVTAIAASAALSPVTSAQSITQLNAFGGGGISVAKGVSNDGSVIAGYAQLFGGAYSGAAIWVGSTDPQQPAGASAGGGFSAEAVGVSADGAVVAGSRIQSAFRWTQSGGSQFMSNLSGGSFTSARGISGNGSVIVGVGDTNAGPFTQTWQRAFRWNSDGSTQQLGSLHPYDHSYANAVNFDGGVIVGESASQAFRWTADGGMTGLGFLSGTSSSKALAVNVDGSVIVGRSGSLAFRWTATGGMQALGSIWSGAYEANAVSADGSLVVGWHGSSYTAMIWDAAGEAMMLSQYLSDRGVDLSGWSALYNAYGMSGDGRFIVGWGSYQGQNRAFIADTGVIPAPGAVALLGLAGFARSRRRR